jgi:molecular chaperone DnaJ
MGSGFASVDSIFEQFGDIFEDFFGFSNEDARPRKGPDLKLELAVDFEDAIFGTTTTLEIAHHEECGACEGTGAAPESAVTVCPSCAGDGQVTIGQGLFKLSQTCTRCDGVGSLVEEPCEECGGKGERDASRSVSIKVPAGVGEGTKLRVPREGLPGRHGGPPGDALVTLVVRPHEHFTRDGLDLHHRASLSFVQAALGCTLEIPTLDDHTTLRVPPGTQHGDVIALEGLGVRHHKGTRVGKLIVTLTPTTPCELDDRARDLLRELAAHTGLDVLDG